MPTTLFDKIWQAHEVTDSLLYIDLHLVHEVTSPQAFESLRLAGREVRRPDRTLATADHNVPTDGSKVAAQIADHLSRVQVETLERNCEEFGVPVYSIGSSRQGIVHVIGPELGVTQPGMAIVCGDSHTSPHGAPRPGGPASSRPPGGGRRARPHPARAGCSPRAPRRGRARRPPPPLPPQTAGPAPPPPRGPGGGGVAVAAD